VALCVGLSDLIPKKQHWTVFLVYGLTVCSLSLKVGYARVCVLKVFSSDDSEVICNWYKKRTACKHMENVCDIKVLHYTSLLLH
jgi:hypothetical protein